MTNPKHGPGWIAAARVEEVAGKMVGFADVVISVSVLTDLYSISGGSSQDDSAGLRGVSRQRRCVVGGRSITFQGECQDYFSECSASYANQCQNMAAGV